MKVDLKEFDAAEYLLDDETRAAYLSEVLESDNIEEFISALNDIAKSIGITKVSKDSGIGRESLYKTLSSKKPRFDTMIKIIHALGMNIQLTSR